MTAEEMQLMVDSTKLLRDMCSNNHEHTKSLNIELQKLVKVIMAIEERVSKLEKK